jgi:hypothetical protein
MHTKRAKTLQMMKKCFPIYLMALPGLIYLFINNYMPLPGLVLAFKNYNARKGIWGSPWVGLSNFKYLFATSDAYVITRNTILYNLTHKGNISLSWFIDGGSYVKSRLCTIAFHADNASLLKDYWLSNDFEYEMNLIESNSTDVSQGGTSLTGWTNKRTEFIAALNNITKANIFIYFRRLRNPNE